MCSILCLSLPLRDTNRMRQKFKEISKSPAQRGHEHVQYKADKQQNANEQIG